MTKKPRQSMRLTERTERPARLKRVKPRRRESLRDEFRNCQASGCPNIVSIADKPGYSGPIYCVLHRDPS